MAQLYRFHKLGDRYDTQIFSLILPSNITRGSLNESFTTDLDYGSQKWKVTFMRSDKHLSACLTLKSNEVYREKDVLFTREQNTHGRRTFIPLEDLMKRSFAFEQGEFICTVELKNARTTFDSVIQLPKDPNRDPYMRSVDFPKLESEHLSFGAIDWNIAIYPQGDCVENVDRCLIHLHRLSNYEHVVLLSFRLIIGHGNRILRSDVIHQTYESDTAYGYVLGSMQDLYSYASSKYRLKVSVEMIKAQFVSIVAIPVLVQGKNQAHLYDRDKQAWMMESDTRGQTLKFRMFYTDVRHIPRKYCRSVSWTIRIIPISETKPILTCLGAPYSNYYHQSEIVDPFEINTGIPMSEINDPDSPYLSKNLGKLAMEIEWTEATLLYYSVYHKLDDNTALHMHQMRREIQALQAENLALEKQLHTLQMTVATGQTLPIAGQPQQPAVAPPMPNNIDGRRSVQNNDSGYLSGPGPNFTDTGSTQSYNYPTPDDYQSTYETDHYSSAPTGAGHSRGAGGYPPDSSRGGYYPGAGAPAGYTATNAAYGTGSGSGASTPSSYHGSGGGNTRHFDGY